MTNSKTDEFDAIKTAVTALEALDEKARGRALSYIADRLGVAVPTPSKPETPASVELSKAASEASNAATGPYATFAELYDAARPRTDIERALVSGYWLQVCQSAENFDGFNANKELKHLGHEVGNITRAIDHLKDQAPALVIQLRKAGSSRQARKLYKVTSSGIREVERLISGQG